MSTEEGTTNILCKMCKPSLESESTQKKSTQKADGFKCKKCDFKSAFKYNYERHVKNQHGTDCEEQTLNEVANNPIIGDKSIEDTSLTMKEDVTTFLKNVGLEQYESILKDNDIDLDILFDLRPEEFMNMAKDLGINSWAHRHKLKRAIEESKSKKIHVNVVDVSKESHNNNDSKNTTLSENVVDVTKEPDYENHSKNTTHSEHDDNTNLIIEKQECDLCLKGTQHKCRLCNKIVCVLLCSLPDPDSDNESHRIHKPGDSRCVETSEFQCAICGKDFKIQEELTKHLETPHESLEHSSTNDAVFECPSCTAKFSRASKLQNHMENVHERSWSSFTLISEAESTIGKYVPCKVCDMMFENEADVYLHMERVHEYGEECALYPCEECGYRGQDKLNLDTHIKECHNSTTQSINQSDSILEEFGIEKLPEYSKRIRQNFDDLVIDDQGNIEIEDSDAEYETEKLLMDDEDDYQSDANTKKRKPTSTIQSKKSKKQKSTSQNALSCEVCDVVFTRKDNLARHNRNKHKR